MLKAIKQFFENNLAEDDTLDIDHRLKLATGALMIEILLQDGKTEPEEIDAVKSALQTKFELSEDETHELFDLAREEARQSVDLHQFTSLIHKHYSVEKKFRIVEYLWIIAYSDNHLDAHEEHIVRRISELLYVSHTDFMKAKHNAQKKLGIN